MNTLERVQAVQQQLETVEAERTVILQERNQLVRELRAGGFTLTQTAAILGISNQRVSQIERHP